MTKPTFSQRMGLKPLKKELQLESMDNRLRIGLWNCLIRFSERADGYYAKYCVKDRELFLRESWSDFFGKRLDELSSFDRFPEKLQTHFFNFKWNQVYDFFEFLFSIQPGLSIYKDFENDINEVLKKESSAYRCVDGNFIPITDDIELKAIEEAGDGKKPLSEPSEHIKKAKKLFSDRESPDYHNSIKESISAVESMCRISAKEKTITLGDALKKMEREGIANVDPALSKGFSSIYGWTSDEGGIRHSMKFGEGSDVGLEDAKFMLVAASAFVNYLKEKAIRAGISIEA
jgi:hypothetical protein